MEVLHLWQEPGKANPLGGIRSALMMLSWCAREKPHCQNAGLAATVLSDAIDRLINANEVLPEELGGTSTTSQIGDEIVKLIG